MEGSWSLILLSTLNGWFNDPGVDYTKPKSACGALSITVHLINCSLQVMFAEI